MTEAEETRATIRVIRNTIFGVVLCATALWGGCAYVGPQYGVWEQQMRGEAEYAKAEQNRRIAVLEAQAELDSAKLKAQSEVERASGVDKANKIIQAGLGGPDGYLHYLWIQALGSNSENVIYVPTEANLPILEAGKRVIEKQAADAQ